MTDLDLVVCPGRKVCAPATPEDEQTLLHLQVGDVITAEVHRSRNGAFHRKFMALVSFVAENHPRLHDNKSVLRELKYRTRHFDEFVTANGTIAYEMRSISWRTMDEVAFQQWVTAAREVVFTELFPDLLRDTVDEEIQRWLEWT